MLEQITDTQIARETELAIGRIDSLSVPGCVASEFLPSVLKSESYCLPEKLFEAEPAITAAILRRLSQNGINLSDENFSLSQAMAKLPENIIRETFLKIAAGQNLAEEQNLIQYKNQLTLRAIAVGCCAKNIAEISAARINPNLAYLAGLLHNIGNLALLEVMPKSFAKIDEEAKSQNKSSSEIQQKHLGCDYTILGKHLAQKWQLPEEISLAIWLHNTNTIAIAEKMPEAKIAQIVQLSCLIAEQCSIGQSAYYNLDLSDLQSELAQSLGLSDEQSQQLKRNLATEVAQKSQFIGIDSPQQKIADYSAIQSTAIELSGENRKLSLENHQMQIASSRLNFVTELLLSVNPNASPLEAAKKITKLWQKFYHTGPVCFYLTWPENEQFLQTVIAENQNTIKTVLLKAPTISPAVPKKDSAVLDAQEYVYWLFEQIDIDFDLSRTKLVPVFSNSKPVGAIVFELRYPADSEQLEQTFKPIASIIASIMAAILTSAGQQELAEQLAKIPAQYKEPKQSPKPQSKPTTKIAYDELVEISAGIAHELNNPLSVIQGRSQLLSEAETDKEKIKILKQIQNNTQELSSIVDELMSFASPNPPRPKMTTVKTLIDEAVQLAALKTHTQNQDIQSDVPQECDVFVDSAQIASAIANILANAIESYLPQNGAVKITAAKTENGDDVKITISDSGCGIEEKNLEKITQPFFSSKPSGRKRGMGLAYAKRMILLNNGSLDITSELENSTEVTINLPHE